jgi:hypothetical protein
MRTRKAQTGWLGMRPIQRLILALLCIAALAMGVTACGDSSATGKQTTPTTTPPNTGITQVVGQNSATPTTFVVGGGNGTVGANEICASEKNVQTSVPASVPVYPGADLRLSYTLDNTGAYGYCATATPPAVADYYLKQLPGKGWSNVKSNPMVIGNQVAGAKGSSSIFVTMLPDAKNAAQCDILIQVIGL